MAMATRYQIDVFVIEMCRDAHTEPCPGAVEFPSLLRPFPWPGVSKITTETPAVFPRLSLVRVGPRSVRYIPYHLIPVQ